MTLVAIISPSAKPMLSLVLELSCPACNRLVNKHGAALKPDLFLGALKCDRCGVHWWATRFDTGSIRGQLLRDFEDVDLVDQLMTLFGLPSLIEEPRFWQVQLDGRQWYRYNQDSAPGIRGRSLTLLRGVVAFLKRAPESHTPPLLEQSLEDLSSKVC
jgi:hypothetical protein